MVQTTLDPSVTEETIEGLRKVVELRKTEQARERDLVKRRKAIEERINEIGRPKTGQAPSKAYQDLSAEYGSVILDIKSCRPQRDFLADEQQRGLECLFAGELFKPMEGPPPEEEVDDKPESAADREQMKIPLDRGTMTLGEVTPHKPSTVRVIDEPGAAIAARPIGDLLELVPDLTIGEVTAIKKAAGGSLINGTTIGAFVVWLKLGDATRLPYFIKGTTRATARHIWRSSALAPLLGAPPTNLDDEADAGDPGDAAATVAPVPAAASDELEGIVGARAAAILIDAGLVSLNDVGIYIGEHGGSDVLTTKVGVTAKAVKELSRALAERDASRATGKPKATTVKPGKPGK